MVLVLERRRLGVARFVINVFLGMHLDEVRLKVPLQMAQALVYTLKYSDVPQVKQFVKLLY
jgi:hypothetical protein